MRLGLSFLRQGTTRRGYVVAHAHELKTVPSVRQFIEPHALVASELSNVKKCLLNLLGTSHPGLSEAAQFYFSQPSSQLRSLLVLLFARATNGFGRDWDQKYWQATLESSTSRAAALNDTLTQSDVLNEWNTNMPDNTATFDSVFPLQQPKTRPSLPSSRPPPSLAKNLSPRLVYPPFLLPTQIRLAQIVEMIHIAFLLHNNISSPMEQTNSAPVTQGGLGNKVAILSGDFLLGRASWALSQLGEGEVMELVASVISNQVEGLFSQMDFNNPELGSNPPLDGLSGLWDRYLRGLYLKTASLMAKGARSAVILGGCRNGDVLREVAYQYGRNLGIALQLMEDAESVTQLQPGVTTGPLLFAAEECPSLIPLVRRNTIKAGDLKMVIECIATTSAVERTRLLAETYAEKAREVLDLVPESETKYALETLVDIIIART